MRFEDYKNPKTIDKKLTKREQRFVQYLVDDKMDVVLAYEKAGYTGKNKGVFKHRANRTQRYLWTHIEARIKEKVSETATTALGVLEELLGSESDTVRLNAARDILSRAGYDAVQKQETTLKDVIELTDEEIDKQIQKLVKDNVVKFPKEVK
jgi:K+/H+ antiporter YhaU regulatory subunit KhtT|tara:strand:+ start:313 stop:768 length:456 start_codon:yes stop_codon:yes gene_type:complete